MVQTICGTEEERHAEESCGKYLQRDGLYAEVGREGVNVLVAKCVSFLAGCLTKQPDQPGFIHGLTHRLKREMFEFGTEFQGCIAVLNLIVSGFC